MGEKIEAILMQGDENGGQLIVLLLQKFLYPMDKSP
jgi:hypothetical protein